jgi:DNA-binding MarR family transcriptional regulator
MDARADADAFAALFPEVYLRFHRRRPRDARLTAQSAAVLAHLELAGPLTVTELARHLSRAQSVCTEIVDRLVARRLLARMADARDRRRHLVWLTPEGQDLLAREREVLDRERLSQAMRRLPAAARAALLRGLRLLVEAPPEADSTPTRRRR